MTSYDTATPPRLIILPASLAVECAAETVVVVASVVVVVVVVVVVFVVVAGPAARRVDTDDVVCRPAAGSRYLLPVVVAEASLARGITDEQSAVVVGLAVR